jgi:hypothetical protein
MQKQMNNAAMVRLLDQSISQFANPGSTEVNEEHLTLLCMGRIDELSAAERYVILRQIAADAELANLVAQMREMGWGEDEHPASTFQDVILRITPIAWSLAACLAVALGVWRFAGSTPNSGNGAVAIRTNSDGNSSLPVMTNPVGGTGQPAAGDHTGLGGSMLGTAQSNSGQNATTTPSTGSSSLTSPGLPVTPTAQGGLNPSNPTAANQPPPMAQNMAAKNSWQIGDWLAVTAIVLAIILTIPAIYWLSYRLQRRTIAP